MHFLNNRHHEVSSYFIPCPPNSTPEVKIMTKEDKATETLTLLKAYDFIINLLLATDSRCLRFRRILRDIRSGLDLISIIFGFLTYITCATDLVSCYYWVW